MVKHGDGFQRAMAGIATAVFGGLTYPITALKVKVKVKESGDRCF